MGRYRSISHVAFVPTTPGTQGSKQGVAPETPVACPQNKAGGWAWPSCCLAVISIDPARFSRGMNCLKARYLDVIDWFSRVGLSSLSSLRYFFSFFFLPLPSRAGFVVVRFATGFAGLLGYGFTGCGCYCVPCRPTRACPRAHTRAREENRRAKQTPMHDCTPHSPNARMLLRKPVSLTKDQSAAGPLAPRRPS